MHAIRRYSTLPALAALLAAALACGDVTTVPPAPTPEPGPPPDAEQGQVVFVVDGDTIDVEIDGEEYRVRYIGVNTPEREEACYDDATYANIELVLGETVTLVRDVSETDPYDRLLRYVYVGDVFVNETLVAEGWAEAASYPPDTTFETLFQALESDAAEAGLGCHPTGIFDDGSTTR